MIVYRHHDGKWYIGIRPFGRRIGPYGRGLTAGLPRGSFRGVWNGEDWLCAEHTEEGAFSTREEVESYIRANRSKLEHAAGFRECAAAA